MASKTRTNRTNNTGTTLNAVGTIMYALRTGEPVNMGAGMERLTELTAQARERAYQVLRELARNALEVTENSCGNMGGARNAYWTVYHDMLRTRLQYVQDNVRVDVNYVATHYASSSATAQAQASFEAGVAQVRGSYRYVGIELEEVAKAAFTMFALARSWAMDATHGTRTKRG